MNHTHDPHNLAGRYYSPHSDTDMTVYGTEHETYQCPLIPLTEATAHA